MEHGCPDTLLADTAWLRRLTRGLIQDPALADEVCQETLIAAEKHPAGTERSWLARVARNLAVSLLRRETRRARHEDRAGREPQHGGRLRQMAAPPDQLIAEAELQRAAVQALMALDEPYRRTLLLRYMKGLSLRQVAREMQAPVETVRTRQKRGLAMLRSRLDGDEQDRRGRAGLALILPLAVPGWPDPSTGALWGFLLMKTKVGVTCAVLLALTALLGVTLFEFHNTGTPEEQANAGKLPAAMGEARPVQPLLARGDSERQELPSAKPSKPKDSTPGMGELIVRVRRQANQKAAAHVGVYVKPCHPWEERGLQSGRDQRLWRGPQPVPMRQHIPDLTATGPDGLARFQLRPGRFLVGIDRSGQTEDTRTVEIHTDKATTVDFALPPGLEVYGVVVDPYGKPVPGADVLCFWEPTGQSWLHVIASTDANGRFRLHDVNKYLRIGARTRAHGTSDFVMALYPKPDSNNVVSIRLTLPKAKASLHGIVVNADGHPAKEALVKVRLTTKRRTGGWTTPPYPHLLTDAEGRFRSDTLRPGEHTLLIFALGHAPHQEEVRCNDARPTQVAIRLRKGSILSGRVLDKSGGPVAMATLELPGVEWPTPTWAWTDEQGQFKIQDLPAGRLEVRVTRLTIGRLLQTLELPLADTLTHDFVLDGGQTIRGVLVDQRGVPLSGWSVSHYARDKDVPRDMRYKVVRTDKQGRFRIPNCPDRPHDLQVTKSMSNLPPVTILKSVRPVADVQTFKILDDWLPSAVLRGRVFAANGAPLQGAQISLRQVDQPFTVFGPTTDAEGRFETAKLPPGRYVLTIANVRHLPHKMEDVQLTKNQEQMLPPVILKLRENKDR